jgi:hypothetical protein
MIHTRRRVYIMFIEIMKPHFGGLLYETNRIVGSKTNPLPRIFIRQWMNEWIEELGFVI